MIRKGDVIDSLQFVYSVVTEDGVSQSYTGNKCGGNGGSQEPLINFSNDEQIKSINIQHNNGIIVGEDAIHYLQIQTSRAPYGFGNFSPTDTEFTLPGSVLFCSSGLYLNSLGAYEIEEVPQKTVTLPAKTFTETSTITDVATSIVTVDSSRNMAIGLGAGFGLVTCLAIGGFT